VSASPVGLAEVTAMGPTCKKVVVLNKRPAD